MKDSRDNRVTLRSDYAFKKVFAQEDSQRIIGRLICLISGLPEEEVAELQIRNPFLDVQSPTQKRPVVDVLIVLKNGRKINVEMQNCWQRDFPRRSMVYMSQMFLEGTAVGKSYQSIPKCIGIYLLNERVPYGEKLHYIFKLREMENGAVYDEGQEYHLLDMTKLPQGEEREKLSELERWLLFIRTDDQSTRDRLSEEDPIMTEANEKIRKVLYEPSELERYQMLRKAEWDYASGMATSFEDGEAKGRAEGLKEGRAEGLSQGRSEGLSQGRAEGLSLGRSEGRLEGNEEVRRQAVQGMKAHGLDNAAIASILKISEKQLSLYLNNEGEE